jgi:hypothetical protein
MRFLYLIDLDLRGGGALPTNSAGNNLLHLEACDHVLLRGLSVEGPSCVTDSCNNLQEVFKANQCQYLYVEDSTMGGAWHSVVDYMVVQYGHILRTHLHAAGQWCGYVKGGSAYLTLDGNEIEGCQLGLQVGQSANFAVMRSPWLHYEAYGVTLINNVLHDIPGVPLSVMGGYNVLIAHNTLYKVATSREPGYALFQSVRGERNCTGIDEMPDPKPACQQRIQQGGWGPGFVTDSQPVVSSRNVYLLNNVFFNPAPSHTLYSHFLVDGPSAAAAGFANLPSPAKTDDRLVIAGNIVWNGPTDHPLGIEESGQGCQPGNPTCNPAQLRSANAINTFEPQLVAPSRGDLRPVPSGNVVAYQAQPFAGFDWSDAPARPAIPKGPSGAGLPATRAGGIRAAPAHPGAF